MKTIIAFILLAASLAASAQAPVPTPYVEDFDTIPAGWTVDNGTAWYQDPSGILVALDTTVSGYYFNLYSPYFKLDTVPDPVLQFLVAVSDRTPAACVPKLEVEYDNGTGAYHLIHDMSSGNYCSPSDIEIGNGSVSRITLSLPKQPLVRLVFSADFVGLGFIAIDNVWVGNRADTPVVSGIHDILPRGMAMTVYPNPAHNTATVSCLARAASEGELSVTDMLGRTMLTEPVAIGAGENRVPIDTRGFAPGLYLVSLRTGDGFVVERLMVE